MDMIVTSECEYCKHGILDEQDKARIKIYCVVKNKSFYYGQCIPCDSKEKIRDEKI